jgi:hypothetical protein
MAAQLPDIPNGRWYVQMRDYPGIGGHRLYLTVPGIVRDTHEDMTFGATITDDELTESGIENAAREIVAQMDRLKTRLEADRARAATLSKQLGIEVKAPN